MNFKLLAAFALCSLFLMAVGTIARRGLQNTIDAYDHVMTINLRKTLERSEMRLAQKDVSLGVMSLVGTHATPAEVSAENNRVAKAIALFEAHAEAYEKIPFAAEERERWDIVKSDWTALAATSRQLLALSRSGTHADEVRRDEIGKSRYVEERKAIRGHFEDLQKIQDADGETHVALAAATGERINRWSLLMVILGTMTSMLIGWFFSKSISRVLRETAGALASGSRAVAEASGQVSSSSQELSAAASEQAASLEETAAALEEMNSMVNKTSENASHTATTSAASRDQAERGREVVDQMIESMGEINASNVRIMAQIDTSNAQIAEIVKVIQEIGNKTKVINDIVFQTKILSFNASVEAARAGEHGKGFAVVAEEVGNLAQMSGNAAKEISTLLEGSISKVETIVRDTSVNVGRLIADGKQKVDHGSIVARQCGEVLAGIVTDVTSVSNMASEISTASREQAQGVQEITKAMGQLDQVTQQNASASEQVASAAEELSAQAEAMKAAATTLSTLIEGRGARAVSLPEPSTARGGKVLPLRRSPGVKAGVTNSAVAGGVPSSTHPGFDDV